MTTPDYSYPGLGSTLEESAAKYAAMFPGVSHLVAKAQMLEARTAKKEPSRARRAKLVAQNVRMARMFARAARIATALPTVSPASKEWAYSDIEADYNAGANTWREVSAAFYWQALEVLPPIYKDGGFLVGEAWTHRADGGAVHAAFTTVAGRYFARMCAPRDLPALAARLRQVVTP